MCLLRIRISQTANEEHLVTLVHGTATLTIHFLDQSMDQLIPKAVSEPPSVLGECSDSARTTSLRGSGSPGLVGNGAHVRILPCRWGTLPDAERTPSITNLPFSTKCATR